MYLKRYVKVGHTSVLWYITVDLVCCGMSVLPSLCAVTNLPLPFLAPPLAGCKLKVITDSTVDIISY